MGVPGVLALLARGGNHAPGTPVGVNYDLLNGPTLNARGGSVFFAKVTGPGITAANSDGFWSGGPRFRTALLARSGDPAPGRAAGVTYSRFDLGFGFHNRIRSAAAGKSAFSAKVTGPGVTSANDECIWSNALGSVAKVVCQGEVAPGAGAGTLFGEFDFTSSFALNDRGEVIFFNHLTGPGVTGANSASLWFSNAAGTLSLIVRAGNPFEVAPGDTRILSDVSFVAGSGDEDGYPCGFNDLGQVAFEASFTDGSQGIFIASVPALRLTAAVSRKKHGSVGAFDINLPLGPPLSPTGEPGVECRSSDGIHTLVFSFNNNVVSGNANVTSGTGLAGSATFGGKTMTVSLSGVADVQKITVTLRDVTDSFAQVSPAKTVKMNMLIGDTTGNKIVNDSDLAQTTGQSGIPVTDSNFRQDVIPDGTIDASDIALVKSRVP